MTSPFTAGRGREPSDTPDTIVGISFDDAFRAQEFLTASLRLAAQNSIELRDAVTIVKDATGKTFVRETIDPPMGMSALSGATWAGLFGLLLGGPVGWLAGAALGAGTGAVRAKMIDLGVPDEWVRWFRDAVQPETVTVVLLLGRFDRDVTMSELERFAGGHLVYANVGPDLIGRIRLALDDATPPDDVIGADQERGQLAAEPASSVPASESATDDSAPG
jgi:uncharacterized membrane protein